jgi:predicted phage tail component-like protein
MKGDFLGFSFDGIHSSRLGITRVSEGDRYDELLVPEIEDKIVDVPGGDGSYFFGSLYRNREISISIAFDSLTENQFRQLRKLLAIRRPCQLVFDERPYKIYTAKISSPPELNYICFDERKKRVGAAREGIRVVDRDYEQGTITRETIYPYEYEDRTERIYKGEGKIEFTCVRPFATDQFKVLDFYGDFEFQTGYDGQTIYRNNPRTPQEARARMSEDGVEQSTDPKYTVVSLEDGNSITAYTNVEEWAESSGILPYEFYARNNVDKVCATNINGYNAYIPVYNAGDVDAPFYLFLPFNDNRVLSQNSGDYIDINLGNNLLRLKPFNSKTTLDKENGIMINTNNHLIEGVKYDIATSAWRTTGNLYNEYIVAGDFTKIRNNDWSMLSLYDSPHFQSIYLNCATAMGAKIHYNYLYY